MYIVAWEYELADRSETPFLAAYGPGGAWSSFFRESPGYEASWLLPRSRGRWILLDLWSSKAAYEGFLASRAHRYASLSAEFRSLYAAERRLGELESGEP